jgi:ribokinase
MTALQTSLAVPSVIDRLRLAATRNTAASIGAVNFDEIFLLAGDMRDDGASHVSDKQLLAGGHAANCASALAKLGFATSVIGAVGKDPMGRWLIDDLRARNIDTTRICEVDAPTGRAIIPVFRNSHFMILERGANDFCADLSDDVLSRFSAIAVFDPALPVLESLAERLAASPSKPDVYWTPGGHYVSQQIVVRLLPHLRAVFLNCTEASDLFRMHGAVLQRAHDTCIVETLGAAGATCRRGETRSHAPGYLTTCVDPTGAGDHFAACFILADQAGLAIDDCLRIANLGGMIAVETLGARAENFGIDRLAAEIATRGVPL